MKSLNRVIGTIEFGVSLLLTMISISIGISVAVTRVDVPVPTTILYAISIASALLFLDSFRRWDMEWNISMERNRRD